MRSEVAADPMLQLAIFAAVALVVMTLLLVLQVLLLSELANRRTRNRRSFDQQWRPVLAEQSLSDTAPPLPCPPPRAQRLWFLLLWNRMQQQLRGQPRERMNHVLRELGLESYVEQMLASRSLRQQLVALGCLRFLHDQRHWDPVRDKLEHRNKAVYLAAARTLVTMDPAQAMRTLVEFVQRHAEWPARHLAAIGREAGKNAVTPAVLEALEHSPHLLRCCPIVTPDWSLRGQDARWQRTRNRSRSSPRCAASRNLAILATAVQ